MLVVRYADAWAYAEGNGWSSQLAEEEVGMEEPNAERVRERGSEELVLFPYADDEVGPSLP